MRILVAHAGTMAAAVAERVAEELRATRLEVDVVPCEQDPPAGSYDAVLLGSTVGDGHWDGSAVRYLRAQEAHLSQRPAFLFEVAPLGDQATHQASPASSAVRRLADLVGAGPPVTFSGPPDGRVDRWAEAVGHDLRGTRSPAASAVALSLI